MRKLSLLYLCFTILLSTSAVSGRLLVVNALKLDLTAPFLFIETYPANVNRVNLSQDIIFADCKSNSKRCSENKQTIDVFTEASQKFNGNFTYVYQVSGGAITGQGANVVWDLSDVKPGEYTIIAAADDSCGVCGQTKTRKVFVVCPEVFAANSFPENISKFNLNRTEIFASCRNGKICSREDHLIKISAALSNPSDSKTIFRYQVSGGRIIGNGTEVEWDLSKVAAGNYSITVSADVGRGFCGNQISQPIRVVKCPRCK